MLQPIVKVPTVWTPLHSVAYLLQCVALADGDVDAVELGEAEKLVLHYGRVSPELAHDTCVLAYDFLG